FDVAPEGQLDVVRSGTVLRGGDRLQSDTEELLPIEAELLGSITQAQATSIPLDVREQHVIFLFTRAIVSLEVRVGQQDLVSADLSRRPPQVAIDPLVHDGGGV